MWAVIQHIPSCSECTVEQCSLHTPFRLQICKQTGLKSSKKLHTRNNLCCCLGNLALTLCLKFSKVQAWVIPLSVQVEITFQSSSAGGKHSKFLKVCLNITVSSFQKQPREVIIILENVGISLHVMVLSTKQVHKAQNVHILFIYSACYFWTQTRDSYPRFNMKK